MKRYLLPAILLLFALSAKANSQATWQEVVQKSIPVKGERKLFPNEYKLYLLNDGYMRNLLFSLSANPAQGSIITLPMPDGQTMNFRIWETPVMHPELAAKFPEIKTFTAVNTENSHITSKICYTGRGFSAMIFNGNDTWLIDPYTTDKDNYYICYYKRDYPRTALHNFSCGTEDVREHELQQGKINIDNEPPRYAFKTSGTEKKVFRLALTCTGEYARAVAGANPAQSVVLAAMITSLNRVNGVLERELSVSMQLIPNNNLLIYLDSTNDPFPDIENSNVSNYTTNTNQKNTDLVIGAANYDIGHVFCTGTNGIADLTAHCDLGHAARGATGAPNPVGDPFDIDYVAHEIGHQLGAEHTFNFSGNGCGSNARPHAAYEPGSGTTLMAYAGLCPAGDLMKNVDEYYHAFSIRQMSDHIATTSIITCGTTTLSNNTPPSVANIKASYNIPISTPFELEAPLAVDTDNDLVNYCWEQYDLGDFGKGPDNTTFGPIIRSQKPTASQWRIIPMLDSLRTGAHSTRPEKTPVITRQVNFRLTVRDMLNGWGAYNTSDDSVTLFADAGAGPFRVLWPNQHSDYMRNGGSYSVTWNPANTTASPVSCSHVNIFLSLDDGRTWPVTLASNTPNDGSELITIPTGSYTAAARVKVKGVGNVFFDMSDKGYVINDWPDGVSEVMVGDDISVYPVPASQAVHISLPAGSIYKATLFNTVGQQVWQQENARGNMQLSVTAFAAGVYQLTLTNQATGNNVVKRVVVK